MKKFVDNNYGKDMINTYRGLLFSNLERSREKDIEDVEAMNFVPQAAYGLSFNPLEYGIIPEAKNDTGIKLGDVINGAVGTQMGRYFQYSPQFTGVKWSVNGQPGTGIRDRGFEVTATGYNYPSTIFACGGLKKFADGSPFNSLSLTDRKLNFGNDFNFRSNQFTSDNTAIPTAFDASVNSFNDWWNNRTPLSTASTTTTTNDEQLPLGWQQYNFDDKVKGTIFTGDGNTQANIIKYQASPDSIKVKYNRIPRSVMKEYLSGNMQANQTQPVSTTPITNVATTDASVVPTSDMRFIDEGTELSSSEFRGNKPKAIQRQIIRNNRAYMRDEQDAWKQNQIATAQQKYNPTDSFEFTGNNLQQNYDAWKQNNKNYRDAVKQINRDARNYFTRKPNNIYETTSYFNPSYACGGKKMALGGKDYMEFFNQDRGTTTTPNGTYDNNLILKSKAKEVNGRDNWWATDMALWDGAKLAANVYDAIQQNKQNNEIRSVDDLGYIAYADNNNPYLRGSEGVLGDRGDYAQGVVNTANMVKPYHQYKCGGKYQNGGVYDLTPDEIREIYANGGRVEFLD